MPAVAPKAAKPTKVFFDPFNSSATGHQRAENRLSGSTLWRDSRHFKLREQFSSGPGGGKRLADTVGAGSDGSVSMGLLENGTVTWRRDHDQLTLQKSLALQEHDDTEQQRSAKRIKVDCVVGDQQLSTGTSSKRKRQEAKHERSNSSPLQYLSPIDPNSSTSTTASKEADLGSEEEEEQAQAQPRPQIFQNLAFYINGSTAPLISDHRLKRTLTEHGARVSIALGRRKITHVIIGRPNSSGGSGGGLAGSKIHKEISSVRGEKVKYITAEWVMESVKAGKRLPESRFEALRLAPKGVGSVASMFGKKQERG